MIMILDFLAVGGGVGGEKQVHFLMCIFICYKYSWLPLGDFEGKKSLIIAELELIILANDFFKN
jgi:hypothetical protein